MISTALLYFGLPFGGIAAAAAAFVFLTPWGPAVLTLVANSKIARAAIAAAAVALAIGLALLKAFNAGKADARRSVDQANAAAEGERQAVDAKAEGDSDDALRRELGRWSSR